MVAEAQMGQVKEPDADNSDVADEDKATEVGLLAVDGGDGRQSGWVVTAGESMPVPEDDVPAAGSAGRGDNPVHAEPLVAPAVENAQSEAESLTDLER